MGSYWWWMLWRTMVGEEEVITTASGYYDLIGKIWLQEYGAYCNMAATGGLYVDSPTGWGGAYFNR